MEVVNQKFVLDACCGSKMMWFDKNNPNVLYMDNRKETHIVKDSSQKTGEREIIISPDIVADYRDMPFPNESYYHIAFDPSHLIKAGDKSWLVKKYGKLPEDWQSYILQGFNECWRVLKPYGTLVFKWNERDVKTNDLLKLLPVKPFHGHTSGRNAQTIFMCFVKIPETHVY